MSSFPLGGGVNGNFTTCGAKEDSRYLICKTAVLTPKELFQHWYQYLVILTGVVTLLAGVAILFSQSISQRQDDASPNLFATFGAWLEQGANRFWKSLHIRRRPERSQSVVSLADKRLNGMTTIQLMNHTGAPQVTPDSSLCILPIDGPSPQKYWDATYTPSIKAAHTPRGDMTPGTGWQTPRTASHTPRANSITARLAHGIPWRESAAFRKSIALIKTQVVSTPMSDDETLAPSRSTDDAISPSFAPVNFVANKEHAERSISAAASPYIGTTGATKPSNSTLFFGYQSFTQEKYDADHPFEPLEMADDLRDTCLYQGFDGVVLLFDDTYKASVVNEFLGYMREHGIPVIFMAESDAFLLDSLNFGLLDGVILQNAHILRNGKRRDFFRAARLRDQIARIKRQQETRPEFFLGFLELWNQQPSAAVLRRAYKLADFFGAVIEARPSNPDHPSRTKQEMPLSGFDLLKKADVVWCQKQWSHEAAFDFTQTADTDHVVRFEASKINDVIPSADRLLALKPLPMDLWNKADRGSQVSALDYNRVAPRLSDFWNTSSCGAPLSSLGAYCLREEVTAEQYEEVLRTQRHLKTLDMLHPMSMVELTPVLESLSNIVKLTSHPVILQDLRDGLKTGAIRVHKGLDSGFTLPDNGGHFLGVSDEVLQNNHTVVDIFLSLKNADDAATIWHVYLAYVGIPRSTRYLEELHFVQGDPNEYGVAVPKSIMKELQESTESEMLYLLQQMRLSALRHPIADATKSICTKLLIDKTTRSTWSEVHSKACLDGSIRLQDLFQMRLDYLKDQGAEALPDVESLVVFHDLLDSKVASCLFDCDRVSLNRLLTIMLETYKAAAEGKSVDVTTDLYSLIFFCVLRKYAFEDVYLETTDRCPLFLSQHDQAGVFAELWVLGSQCAIYFGIYPRALGEIIYDRYRAYLEGNSPPVSSWDGANVFTAYSNVSAKHKVEGYDPLAKAGKMKSLPGAVPGNKLNEPNQDKKKKQNDTAQRLGALSIFCVPAMVDVLLLTFVGRGFYLTAFMGRHTDMANKAILTALLMTGGITGWVGSTGGYYLYNYAFENMVHFFVQRFSAAFLLTSVVAFCGFIVFGIQDGWTSALIFVAYLYALTTFLNILGILASMHMPGSPLTSGRTSMWKCIPILFISPILTSFVNGHDLLVYLIVVYTFVVTLLVVFRNLCHEWTSWQAKIPTIKEKDLIAWFKEKVLDPDDEDDDFGDEALLAAEARDLLKAEVHQYHNRSLYMKIFYTVSDQFVKKMAVGHPYAVWLLEKEAGGQDLPETYTATWFVQLELALGNQRQLVRGLREHSQFITFRYSKYDLGQNVGLFLGALMDRWVMLVMSARKGGADFVPYKYTLCFALLYFLLGAVAVDIILQKYWPEMSKLSGLRMTDMTDFENIRQVQAATRRKLYRSALSELFTLLSLVLGLTTILVWAFVPDGSGILLFYTYVTGYTGALMFQFHRCFTKNPRAHIVTVFTCCALGFIVGVILRAVPSTTSWMWDYVIALNISTVGAAITTFFWTGYLESPQPLQKIAMSGDRRAFVDARVTQLKSNPTSRGSSRGTPSEHDGESCDDVHRAIRDMLRNLTLEVDVNVKWALLPEDVRKFIVSRVLGTPVQLSWNVRTWLVDEGKNISRFNHGVGLAITELRRSVTSRKERNSSMTPSSMAITAAESEPELSAALPKARENYNIVVRAGQFIVRSLHDIVKWVAIISGAASDTPKELWYALRANPFRTVLLWVLLKIWKVCWWVKNLLIGTFLVAGKKPYIKFLHLVHHGNARILDGHRIVVETATSTQTGFLSRTNASNLVIAVYEGELKLEPANKKPVATAFYGSSHRLHAREESNGAVSTYHYDPTSIERWPTAKIVVEDGMEHRYSYDKFGRIKSGRIFRGEQEFSFEYVFSKRPKGNSEVLQANYSSITEGLPMSLTVFWSTQPRGGSDVVKNWVSSEKIQRSILTLDGETFDTRWIYKHALDPELETTVVRKNVSETYSGAPEQILKDEFGFLKKPKHVHFEEEDLLIHHPIDWLDRVRRPYTLDAHSWSAGERNRLIKPMPVNLKKSDRKVIYRKMTTAQLRTTLWKTWAKPPYLDAVTACFLDEMILRKEPLLHKYWWLRDAGHLLQAAHTLDANLEQIVSAIEPTVEASQTCPLYIKVSDLFEMGLAKDSNSLTARPEDAYRDTPNSTSVIFSDNGCWPDNPGGVSNCRRDLVNGHTTIRGHCLAEGANDYGVPRYQIERNINSLKVLPLWGLDGKTAYHGLLDNLLQSQIEDRINKTDEEQDVKNIFIPLLKNFVRGARSRRYNRQDLVTYSNVILKMNRYFETRDFNKTWLCESVWEAWVEAWLMDYDDPNIVNIRDMMEIEKPSMNDFRDALNLYICYFFIYSVEIPANCPKVFQTTHHGISSLYGILLKYRRGTVWGIWDHAILWREMCLNISPAQCLLPVPVQSMLLSGVKLACHLAYTHADIILPCTSVFNPDWEQDLGTDSGLRGSKKLFARKIDPIVNGIGNMDAFQPVKETRTKFPTTVMLSNVQFIKDVKNAVLAADVIINKFGFKEYRLTVYGAQDRQPSYALETTTMINTRGMSGKVTLAGFGSPKEVLKDAWLFMNSSLSEGLPLAIGEAALSGIPIVATEVGATALVLTDPDDPTKRYGEVVPPNDPEALARAQISILAMLGPWAQYTKDEVAPPPLPDVFTPDDVKWITERMYEKTEDRKALGLKLREVVLRSFHGKRYLREHEQMYWIQRKQAETRRAGRALKMHPPPAAVFGEQPLYTYDQFAEDEQEVRPRWQDFSVRKLRPKRSKNFDNKEYVELGEKL